VQGDTGDWNCVQGDTGDWSCVQGDTGDGAVSLTLREERRLRVF
jgi:hypothetical protein